MLDGARASLNFPTLWVVRCPLWCPIGPLHDPVTWYKITYTGEQVAQWDFQNKGRWIVLEVPLCNLLTSICNFNPCDRVVQRAYKYKSFYWLITRHLQVIICGCWIFALFLNLPLFLVTIFDESNGDCKWNWPESWMGAAYDTIWLVLLAIIPLIVMTVLYSRVVYTLWFKRNDNNELVFQQRVRIIRKNLLLKKKKTRK